MQYIVLLVDHLLPVTITLVLLATILLVRWGFPYLYHIALVASADNEEGVNKLAQHLAHEAGGKRIHVGRTWESFVPAAKDIHQLHIERLDRFTTKS